MQLVLNTYTSSSPLSSNFSAKGRSRVRTFWISPDWYKLVIEPERSITTNTLARWELKSMFFSFFSRTMWRSRPSSALLRTTFAEELVNVVVSVFTGVELLVELLELFFFLKPKTYYYLHSVNKLLQRILQYKDFIISFMNG